MKLCWESRADLRPTFTQLLTNLSFLLESMADYFDFFTLGNPHTITEEDRNPFLSRTIPPAISLSMPSQDATYADHRSIQQPPLSAMQSCGSFRLPPIPEMQSKNRKTL